MDRLVEQVLAGRRRAIARTISHVEDGGSQAQAAIAAIHPHTGRAHIVGVTGPPGSGKSTLVNALALHFRQGTAGQPPQLVGIIAVDPTSPFSGGAILGDRIRMRDLAGDPGIFIRSMASRGNLGGLAWATADAVKVLDAGGYELIFVETVGAGQGEVSIARTAHTTIVVEVPGMGDDIQAIKAGVLEVADVFAVNKADYEGADHAVMALRMMLDLGQSEGAVAMHRSRMRGPTSTIMEAILAARNRAGTAGQEDRSGGDFAPWRPPIHKTVATRKEGIGELGDAIGAHRAHLDKSGGLAWRERQRAAAELETIIQQESLRCVLARTDQQQLSQLLDQIVDRKVDAFTACQRLLRT